VQIGYQESRKKQRRKGRQQDRNARGAARQPAAYLIPHITGAQGASFDLGAQGLHNLPQRPLRSAPDARVGPWSTREPQRFGIAAAFRWHRMPATGALIFRFPDFPVSLVDVKIVMQFRRSVRW
jgi:hypothetical protein